LGKFYKPNMTSEQMFKLVDKLTYQIKSTNPDKIYISNNFYKLIEEINFKNLEWFSLEDIKLIYKYLFYIIMFHKNLKYQFFYVRIYTSISIYMIYKFFIIFIFIDIYWNIRL
jgi:hypothetical protein